MQQYLSIMTVMMLQNKKQILFQMLYLLIQEGENGKYMFLAQQVTNLDKKQDLPVKMFLLQQI